MILNHRGSSPPLLVLLTALCAGLMFMVWPTHANARLRDIVTVGDPTDDQSPAPGPGAKAASLRQATLSSEVSTPDRHSIDPRAWRISNRAHLVLILHGRLLTIEFDRWGLHIR